MRFLAACALAMLSFATVSSADPIDFDSDSPGPQPQPFTSVDSLIVHFSNTGGYGLEVDNYGYESDYTQALGVYGGHYPTMLQMDFDLDMAALSLDFDGDYGYFGILKLYNDGAFVGMSVVVLNPYTTDYSIGFVGPNFDQAFFYYGDANFQPYAGGNYGVIGVVDNVNYRVPEPSLLALSGLGALVVAWRRRRKIA